MNLKKIIVRYSPTILTCVGAAGVITTAVLTGKATIKAVRILDEIKPESKFEIVKDVWPCYIPAIMTGAATLTCIFGANVLNKRQQVAITSAYILLDRTYKDYRSKVNAIFGEDADQRVKNAQAQDLYNESDISPSNDKLLFYEDHYGKFFERTLLEVQDAEYQLNRKLVKDGEASVNDFLYFLNLPKNEIGDALGWSQELFSDVSNPSWIDFEHELVKMDDGMECYIINAVDGPTMNFDLPF